MNASPKPISTRKTNLVGNLLLRKEFYGGAFDSEDIFVVSPSTKTDHKLKVIEAAPGSYASLRLDAEEK